MGKNDGNSKSSNIQNMNQVQLRIDGFVVRMASLAS